MPFADVPVSPRPLAPGRVRRSASKPQLVPAEAPFNARAPPPYTPVATVPSETRSSTPDLLEQLTGSVDRSVSSNLHEYPGESAVSTEALDELLLRAGNIIREREQGESVITGTYSTHFNLNVFAELDLSSQSRRTLLENNASLKARNDALIARLPSSKPSSPISSPPQTFVSLSSLSPTALGTLSPSPSGSGWSPQLPSSARRRFGHSRKPSTPAELAALADQNAELLSKFQDLESEATRSEQAGKRRLRALEREIGVLKEELDKTRALGERLEESLQSQGGSANGNGEGKSGLPEELEKELFKVWKRLAREAKVKEMRAKARPWEVEESEPKDFAPSNPLFAPARTSTPGTRPSVANNSSASESSARSLDASELGSQPKELTDVDDPFLSSDQAQANLDSVKQHALASSSLSPGRERAIVAKLLAKIAELEETNTSLAQEHQTSQARLREAEREADGVRALCEIISEEVELEIVALDEGNGRELSHLEHGDSGIRKTEPSPRRTIRLRSLGRKNSLNFDSTDRERSLNEGKLRKYSSMENLASGSEQSTRGNTPNRLLAQDDDMKPSEDRRSGLRPRKSIPKIRRSVRGLFDNSLSSTDFRTSDSSSSGFGLPGIAEGPASPNREQVNTEFALPQIIAPRSPNALYNGDFHMGEERQIPSLCSELGGEVGLGLMPSMTHMRSNSIVELLNEAEGEPASGSMSPPSTLRVRDSNLSPTLSRRKAMGTPSCRIPDMSSTPRSPGNGKSSKKFAEDDLSMRSASLDEEIMFPRLRRARSSVLSSQSASFENQALDVFQETPETQEPEQETRGTSHTTLETPISSDKHQRKQRTKSAALLIELWLWLQFAVVIVVFLFAMARMGPRTFFRKSKTVSQRPNGN